MYEQLHQQKYAGYDYPPKYQNTSRVELNSRWSLDIDE